MWPFKKVSASGRLYQEPVLDSESFAMFESTIAVAVNSFEYVGLQAALERVESIAVVLKTLDVRHPNTTKAYEMYIKGIRTIKENNNQVILTQIATNTYVKKSAGTGQFTTADQYNVQMASHDGVSIQQQQADQRNLESYIKASAQGLANMHNLP